MPIAESRVRIASVPRATRPNPRRGKVIEHLALGGVLAFELEPGAVVVLGDDEVHVRLLYLT